MRQKYDVIFPIGATCACSQTLRGAGLQYASLPYDWAFCKDMRFKLEYLCAGCPHLLEAKDLLIKDDPDRGKDCWQDVRGFRWPHDLHVGVPLEEQLPAVHAKYMRRLERLFRLLDSAHHALAVYLDNKLIPSPTDADVQGWQRLLAERWPKAGLEILVLRHAKNVAIEDARITQGDGYRIIDVDCCSCNGTDRDEEMHKQLGALIAKYCDVVDYRTPTEKREGPRKRRLAKYGKFGAKSFWGYHFNRLEYKLYRHLQKRVTRKGLA